MLIKIAYTVSILQLLLIGICLTGVFTDEHTRRTDQLLLSGRLGKKELFRVKMLAGMSFAAVSGQRAVIAVIVMKSNEKSGIPSK